MLAAKKPSCWRARCFYGGLLNAGLVFAITVSLGDAVTGDVLVPLGLPAVESPSGRCCCQNAVSLLLGIGPYVSGRAGQLIAVLHLQPHGVAARRVLRWSCAVGINKTTPIHHFDQLVGVQRSGKPQISLWPSLFSVSI